MNALLLIDDVLWDKNLNNRYGFLFMKLKRIDGKLYWCYEVEKGMRIASSIEVALSIAAEEYPELRVLAGDPYKRIDHNSYIELSYESYPL